MSGTQQQKDTAAERREERAEEKREEKREDAAAAKAAADAAAPTPPVAAKADPAPMDLVTVKNHGEVQWVGSDYVGQGDRTIKAGGTGQVTYKKALELKRDFDPHAADKWAPGPFEIVGN